MHRLNVLPNWHTSSISQTGILRSTIQDGKTETIYPLPYWPGDSTANHIEFALKYDGVNLEVLSALFEMVPEKEIADWIESTPTGKYARKTWFLFEFLTGKKLSLPDLTKGNYVELLEPDLYYITAPGRRIQRQRVVDNLLGVNSFSPIIRRTDKLASMEGIDLRKRCEDVITAYPPELLRRALSYLYSKETKSSFEIEHIKPSASRTEKFIGLLEMAENRDFCEKAQLIDVQNRIVDPRFKDADYRKTQNYIGQTVSYQKQIVHYICPKPEDVKSFMDGMISSHQKMKEGKVPAVIHAAAISYGFVFIHPLRMEMGAYTVFSFTIFSL